MTDRDAGTAADGEWLTTGQAARRIERGPQRVRQLVADGRLEAQRTPLGRLISAKSVDALLRERRSGKGGRGG